MAKIVTITLENDVLIVDRDGEKITDLKDITAFLDEISKMAQNLYHATVSIARDQNDQAQSLGTLTAQFTKGAAPKL